MWGNGIGMGRGQKGGMGLSMIKIFIFFVCVFNPFRTFFSVKKKIILGVILRVSEKVFELIARISILEFCPLVQIID